MGAKECWIAFRGIDSATVQARVGKYPTGLRDSVPGHGYWEARFGEWIVIAEAAYSELCDAAGLEKYSAGCELVAGTFVENTCYSAVTQWNDGRQIWALTYDYESAAHPVAGTLPAGLQAWASACEIGSEFSTAVPDSPGGLIPSDRGFDFDVPADIGEQLTGYRYLTSYENDRFELLASADAADSAQSLLAALPAALASCGYAATGHLQFTTAGPCAGLQQEVCAEITINGRDEVRLSGRAELHCPGLPGFGYHHRVAWTSFSHLSLPAGNAAAVVAPGKAAAAADWFSGIVSGPIAEWFAGYGSPRRLLSLARPQSRFSLRGRNIDHPLIQAAAYAGACGDNAGGAAQLMRWYLRRRRFGSRAEFQAAQRFHYALVDRFPHYADACAGRVPNHVQRPPVTSRRQR